MSRSSRAPLAASSALRESERERERESVCERERCSVCVCLREGGREREKESKCVREREVDRAVNSHVRCRQEVSI